MSEFNYPILEEDEDDLDLDDDFDLDDEVDSYCDWDDDELLPDEDFLW